MPIKVPAGGVVDVGELKLDPEKVKASEPKAK
jgi:hypothetical protein